LLSSENRATDPGVHQPTGRDPAPDAVSSSVAFLEDLQLQRVVLDFLISCFPEQLTLDELTRELATDPTAFSERDAISNAVRDVAGAGLIHRHGHFLFPSHAALEAHRLFDR
jgi:hypothetical protein